MESREQRIMNLATTLKSSGIAKTDSQARMMAEDMIGVEEHVQKSYEEEHVKAHEYLQTAKNLGNPRPTSQSVSQPTSVQSAKIEPLPVSKKASSEYVQQMPSRSSPSSEYTDVSFGSKTLNQANIEAQDHDTHNPAIEAMKEQMRNTRIVPLEDMDQPTQSVSAQSLLEEVSKEDISDDDSDSPVAPVDATVDTTITPYEVLEAPEQEPQTPLVEEIETTPTVEPIDTEETHVEAEEDSSETEVATSVDDGQLDTQKLVEMMEEDGKLEEHTRQITEKPKDVKPKEAYEENNINLSNMFDFNKGTVRK